jgi:hypothetical protein
MNLLLALALADDLCAREDGANDGEEKVGELGTLENTALYRDHPVALGRLLRKYAVSL